MMFKNLFYKNPVDKDYINVLSQLDRILLIIYGTSNSGADRDEIFSGKTKTEFTGLLGVFFTNDHDPEIKALEYLEELDLIKLNKPNHKYYLTYKGIMRLHSNSFEQEYRREVHQNYLIRQYQETDVITKNLAIIVSAISIFISLTTYFR